MGRKGWLSQMSVVQGKQRAGGDLLRKHFGAVLSEREVEVASLAIAGVPTAQIASSLFLSMNTVKTHIKNILKKTQSASRMDLYRKLTEAHLAEPVQTASPDPSAQADSDQGQASGGAGPHSVLILRVEEGPGMRAMIGALSGAVRAGDKLFQQGDAEILVVLPATSMATAWEVGRRLCRRLKEWGESQGLTLEVAVDAGDNVPKCELPDSLQEPVASVAGTSPS